MEETSRRRLKKAIKKGEVTWSDLNAQLIAAEDKKLNKAKQISIFDILEKKENDKECKRDSGSR